MMANNELRQVFHMKEGNDEASYAKASYLQKQILLLPKSIREKAIKEVYCMEQRSTPLCIADLGCSSAEENSLGVTYELIRIVDEARQELGHGPQEYQVHLNDLPMNDFNTVFRSISKFEEKLKQQFGDNFGHCFVAGVPGSFHGRLFPTNSLHFVHSSSSVHWLSQVPKGIENNKKNICISKTSPPSVLKAYSDQFQKDILSFLRCRSKEVVIGGKMVLTFLIREKDDPYSNQEFAYIWDLLAVVLSDMVSEGYIEEKKLNTFNVPMYAPSLEELKDLVGKEGSFAVDEVHIFGVSWEVNDDKHANLTNNNSTFDSYDFAKCIRSAAEPLLVSHFGEAIMDEVFRRYREVVHASMTKEKNEFINVTISLTKLHA